jgi:Flp pilus assembly protein TadG
MSNQPLQNGHGKTGQRRNDRGKKWRRESGTSLILGTASMIFLIPMVGLAVDTGFLYSAKARLQASVDGASLAAARALNLGATLQSQQAAAAQNALNWFYANFPSAAWATTGTSMSITGETNSAAGFGAAGQSVHIYPDATNPQLDHVDVIATTTVPTWFMRWFGYNTLTISATGKATRRAVVMMLVLDRSGSMCTVGGVTNQPCTKADSTTPCAAMITAAKQFVGQFAPGRDYIGLVSFSTVGYVSSIPTTNFQATLGYSNSSGTANGAIDNLTCWHGTNTPLGISMAYQSLYQTGLPGALNIITLETDGLPNSATVNLWDNTNTVAGLTNSSNCTDTAGKKMNSSPTPGFGSAAVVPTWGRTTIPGLTLNAAPFATVAGYYSNIGNGMIGTVASSDPQASGNNNGNTMSLFFNYWNTNGATAQSPQSTGTGADPYNSNAAENAPGCSFNGSIVNSTNPGDIKWWPSQDVFGNSLNPANAYMTVTTDAQGHLVNSTLSPPNNWQNWHNGIVNATDNSAYRARGNATIPAYVFAILLEGNTTSPMDYHLMQRLANDPNADQFNATPKYSACPSCATAGQYTGMFVDSPNQSTLNSAFLQVSSQILRLNQ